MSNCMTRRQRNARRMGRRRKMLQEAMRWHHRYWECRGQLKEALAEIARLKSGRGNP